MDPVSIFQIVSSAVSLGDVVVKCITRLSSLKSKYHDAPIILSTMIGQLYMVQVAIEQLSEWSKPERSHDPRYQQLAVQVSHSLDSFDLLILALQQLLDYVDSAAPAPMSVKRRIAFLWSEKEMAGYSVLLDRQANALNLLLQAIQCRDWSQQNAVINQEENQEILRLARDCSSSIIGLEDSTSFITENTADISVEFDFDAVILGSKTYRAAERSHLRQAIRAGRPQTDMANELDADSINSSLPTDKRDGPGSEQNIPEARFAQTPNTQMSSLKTPSQKPVAMRSFEQHLNNRQTYVAASPNNRNDSTQHFSPARILRQLRTLGFGSWSRNMPQRGTGISRSGELDPTSTTISLHGYIKQRKVLILGTSDSSKTALMESLQLELYSHSKEQHGRFRSKVCSHIIGHTRLILEAMAAQQMTLAESGVSIEHHVRTIFSQPSNIDSVSPDIADATKALWDDEGFQIAYRQIHMDQPDESIRHFAKDIQRLASPEYVPTNEDILRIWRSTRNTWETTFDVHGVEYLLYDMEGVRSQRRHSTHTFRDVSTVLFAVDTTNYARVLQEDETVNQREEQLRLFDSIVNSRLFTRTNFVVIFTKLDLLEERLRTSPAEDLFLETTTFGSMQNYLRHLEGIFMGLVRSENSHRRVRFVHTSLVGTDYQNPAREIFRILSETALTQSQVGEP
ncbi:hypothetical protein JX266_006305 [Neoarthrinium moseri]|nr:hypothetical protein JX266_006305 [Neoarthrinium moseri]